MVRKLTALATAVAFAFSLLLAPSAATAEASQGSDPHHPKPHHPKPHHPHR